MKTILSIVIAVMTLSAQAEDMQKYLTETQEMVREGKHEEALQRFIWFHDHALEHEPAMYGVRLSFALGYWKALGDVYPPAKLALVETRDRKENILLEGGGSPLLFHDVVALNRTLAEQEKTVSLFDTLDQKEPQTAKLYWEAAKDAVIAAKRYDLARKYIGNPVREFTKVKAMYDHNTTLYDDPGTGGDHFKAYNENNLVEESLKLIEVAIALDDRPAAKEIQAKALTVLDDYRLRDAMPAESNEEVQQSGEQGR
ncbi:MAG: hypothetical protein AB7T27_02125 [Kiritimatiellia bacterium]